MNTPSRIFELSGGIRGLLLGSTSPATVRHAPCPVVMARPHNRTGSSLSTTTRPSRHDVPGTQAAEEPPAHSAFGAAPMRLHMKRITPVTASRLHLENFGAAAFTRTMT
ncbi:MAG TPA: universal stress protein [Pseudonocardiaceae bacterium]